MTATENSEKNGPPGNTQSHAARRRWGILLTAVCLMGIVVYVFLIKPAKTPAPSANKGPSPPSQTPAVTAA
jgi:hypothetical protein